MPKPTTEEIAGTIEQTMNYDDLKNLGVNPRNLNDLRDYNDEDCMNFDME
jgi:hypothetical protein